MNRSILAASTAACFYFSFAVPLLAAQPAATGKVSEPAAADKKVTDIKPAKKCLSDLRAFDNQLEKDRYWLGGSGYGYGYPMDGFGYGYGPPMIDGHPSANTTRYENARPGYEFRTLIASASILARHGQQQECESILATTRDIYKVYVAAIHSSGGRTADVPGWQRQQIAAAQPVTSKNASYRSDELLGIDVRNPQNEPLGSVEDLVMSPQTGKIAYLVIARGGIFGIDEKYVPVPWSDLKISPNSTLLVLDTTKALVEGAPQVSKDQFTTPGQFDQESQKVDAYWKALISDKGTTGSKN
jgi:sporulation protein YlmC with PRC-barrel domain